MKKLLERLLGTQQEKEKQTPTEDKTESQKEKPKNIPNLISYLGFYADAGQKVAARVYQIAKHYPASIGNHQNYIGGLWDHSIEVALDMAKRFRDTKKAFLAFVVGLLHDIGKIALFEVETQYKYNPLLLSCVSNSFRVTGTKDRDGIHAEMSVFFAYYFLQDVLTDLTTDDVLSILQAIRLHHSKTITANEFLDALRECDKANAIDDIREMIKQNESELSQQSDNLSDLEHETQERDRVDLFRFREIFRQMVQARKLIADYHFYVVNYEDRNLVLVASPQSFHNLTSEYCNQTGMMLHDMVFMQALEQAGWIAMKDQKENTPVVKATLIIQNRNRTLKFIVLKAEKLFSPDEIKQFYSQTEKTKIRGYFIDS